MKFKKWLALLLALLLFLCATACNYSGDDRKDDSSSDVISASAPLLSRVAGVSAAVAKNSTMQSAYTSNKSTRPITVSAGKYCAILEKA